MDFERIVSQANDIVIVAEINRRDGRFEIIYTNEAFTRVFGYSAEEARGWSPRRLQGPDTDPTAVDEISQAVHRGVAIRRRLLNYTRDGQRIWVEVNIVPLPNAEGVVTHFAAIERDVTNDVQRELALEDLALTDPLTQAGNRRYFDQVLARELSRARRTREAVGLAILDLDHFKAVNDVWGHQAGDRVLIGVAELLHQVVRNYDYVARVGGEEFAVILPNARPSDALTVVERICTRLRSQWIAVTDEKSIQVTCSVGISTAALGESSDHLFHRCDRALYKAKADGRDRIVAAA